MAAIVSRIHLSDVPHKRVPLAHHKAGLQYTRTGYGARIPTEHMVQINGSPRWRRVYCCQYSNAGTCYVDTPEGWIVVLD